MSDKGSEHWGIQATSSEQSAEGGRQAVHSPNLGLYGNYDGFPADGNKVSRAFS